MISFRSNSLNCAELLSQNQERKVSFNSRVVQSRSHQNDFSSKRLLNRLHCCPNSVSFVLGLDEFVFPVVCFKGVFLFLYLLLTLLLLGLFFFLFFFFFKLFLLLFRNFFRVILLFLNLLFVLDRLLGRHYQINLILILHLFRILSYNKIK